VGRRVGIGAFVERRVGEVFVGVRVGGLVGLGTFVVLEVTSIRLWVGFGTLPGPVIEGNPSDSCAGFASFPKPVIKGNPADSCVVSVVSKIGLCVGLEDCLSGLSIPGHAGLPLGSTGGDCDKELDVDTVDTGADLSVVCGLWDWPSVISSSGLSFCVRDVVVLGPSGLIVEIGSLVDSTGVVWERVVDLSVVGGGDVVVLGPSGLIVENVVVLNGLGVLPDGNSSSSGLSVIIGDVVVLGLSGLIVEIRSLVDSTGVVWERMVDLFVVGGGDVVVLGPSGLIVENVVVLNGLGVLPDGNSALSGLSVGGGDVVVLGLSGLLVTIKSLVVNPDVVWDKPTEFSVDVNDVGSVVVSPASSVVGLVKDGNRGRTVPIVVISSISDVVDVLLEVEVAVLLVVVAGVIVVRLLNMVCLVVVEVSTVGLIVVTMTVVVSHHGTVTDVGLGHTVTFDSVVLNMNGVVVLNGADFLVVVIIVVVVVVVVDGRDVFVKICIALV
jgi:hypothetical protein